jgi:hypothetical protein
MSKPTFRKAKNSVVTLRSRVEGIQMHSESKKNSTARELFKTSFSKKFDSMKKKISQE